MMYSDKVHPIPLLPILYFPLPNFLLNYLIILSYLYTDCSILSFLISHSLPPLPLSPMAFTLPLFPYSVASNPTMDTK